MSANIYSVIGNPQHLRLLLLLCFCFCFCCCCCCCCCFCFCCCCILFLAFTSALCCSFLSASSLICSFAILTWPPPTGLTNSALLSLLLFSSQLCSVAHLLFLGSLPFCFRLAADSLFTCAKASSASACAVLAASSFRYCNILSLSSVTFSILSA